MPPRGFTWIGEANAQKIGKGVIHMKSKPCCVVLFLLCFICASCTTLKNRQDEKNAVAELQSNDWTVREKGLYRLGDLGTKTATLSEETQNVLVRLLENEVKQAEMRESKPQDLPSEKQQEYDDYIRTLALSLAYNNVHNSFRLLFDLMTKANYPIPPALLAMYGKDNLSFLLDKASNGLTREKEIALSALSIWSHSDADSEDFEKSKISRLNEKEVKIIVALFMKNAEAPASEMRLLSLYALKKHIDKDDVRKLIKKLADTDSVLSVKKEAIRIMNENDDLEW